MNLQLVQHTSASSRILHNRGVTNTLQCAQCLQAVVGARERSTKAISLVAVNDRLNGCVSARSQEQQANEAKYDVEEESDVSTKSAILPEIRSILLPAKSNVRHTPEDEPEKRVKQRAHEREQVGEEWNDLSDDEGENP